MWTGFALTTRKYDDGVLFYSNTVTYLFRKMDHIVSEPGASIKEVIGILKFLCKPSLAGAKGLIPEGESKGRRKLDGFMNIYIRGEDERPPQKMDKPPDTVKEALEQADIKFTAPPRPKSLEQIEAEEGFWHGAWEATEKTFSSGAGFYEGMDNLTKYALTTRSKTASRQIGDLFWTHLLAPATKGAPRTVDKIFTEGDVLRGLYSYILSRVDVMAIAMKVMECLHLKYSLDEFIDMLCDYMLKKLFQVDDIGEVTKMIEELAAKSVHLDFPAGGVTLAEGSEILAKLSEYLVDFTSQAFDDPFYEAAVKATADKPLGKRWLCELILSSTAAGIWALYEFFASLNDPDVEKPVGIPAFKKCNPTLTLPDEIPPWDQMLKFIIAKLKDYAEVFLLELVFKPINALLLELADYCNPDTEYGGVKVEDVIPPDLPGKQKVAKHFEGTDVDDPEEFLADLLAWLTKSEICELFNGTAGWPLLANVKSWMKREHPNFANLFSTYDKILSFFDGLGSILDLSSCEVEIPPPPGLEDLCADGVTSRTEALRQSLLAKGLSEEEVNQQLELDKKLIGEQVSEIMQAINMPVDIPTKDPDTKDLVSGIMTDAELSLIHISEPTRPY